MKLTLKECHFYRLKNRNQPQHRELYILTAYDKDSSIYVEIYSPRFLYLKWRKVSSSEMQYIFDTIGNDSRWIFLHTLNLKGVIDE